MAEAHDRREILYQNLIDIGLGEEDAKKCMTFCEEGRTDAALRFLNGYRRGLLLSIHNKQKQIDCLDFLTHRISRQS